MSIETDDDRSSATDRPQGQSERADETLVARPPDKAAKTPSSPASTPKTPPAPRGSLRLLIDPIFGPFMFGKIVSTIGVWIHNIVSSILAYQLTRSALIVGLVSIAQFTPQLLLSLYSGAIADRGNRRTQIVAGRLTVALGTGAMAVTLAVVGADGLPGPWPLIAAAFVVGIGFTVGGPAMHAVVPSMVKPHELPAAVSLMQFPLTVGRATGPAIGALVAATLGPALAFSLASGANLLFGVIVALLPLAGRSHKAPARQRAIRNALGFIRADRSLAGMLLAIAALGVGVDPAITLTPPLADHFGQGAQLVGMFSSAFGTGAAVSYVIVGWLRARVGISLLPSVGLGLLGTGMVAIAISPTAGIAIAAFAVAGAGLIVALTSLSTLIQQRIDESMRGRIMAFWTIAFVGSRPLAAAMNGSVTDAFSVQVAACLVAIIAFAAAVRVRRSNVAATPTPPAPSA